MKHFFEFSDIRYRFEGNQQQLSAAGSVETGEILALTGPSGAGKSTLLRILCRLIAPEQGEIRLKGVDYHCFSPQEWRRKVQYLPQKPALFEGSVEHNLQMPFRLTGVHREINFDSNAALELLKQTGLSREVFRQQADSLSGGEAARAALVRAMLLQPEVLLLDEPTAALDNQSRKRVMDLLVHWLHEEPERAIIMVSHNHDDFNEVPEMRELKMLPGKGVHDHGL